MNVNIELYRSLAMELAQKNITLVAVSKTKPVEDIKELYELGQKDFGENYVQELVDKHEQLPKDIRWHFIGHLQSNKVKYIAPFVSLIHGVDSLKLLQEINKQAEKNGRVINCLLQVFIADEETKFGLDENELDSVIKQMAETPMKNIVIKGLMGMASFTDDKEKIRKEFTCLKSLYDRYAGRSTNNVQLSTLSMGMSVDYEMAIVQGSNMVRIGSLLFGKRN